MSTEYAGNDSYPATITVVSDDEEFDAASVAVAFQQLRDGETYLKARIDGGEGFEFTDAILHGDTTFPDGSITANLDDDCSIQTDADIILNASGDLVFLGDSADFLGGKVNIGATLITLADDVNLGGAGADAITVVGTLTTQQNVTFGGGSIIAVAVNTHMTVNGAGKTITFGSSLAEVDFASDVFVSKVLHLDTAGHILERPIAGASSDHTYGINDADEVAVPQLTVASITYLLSATGAATGARMRFTAWANIGSYTCHIDTVENTYFLGSSGDTMCLDVVYRSGAWHTSNVTPV